MQVLQGAETVIVPEVDFKVEDVCNKLKTTQKRGKDTV